MDEKNLNRVQDAILGGVSDRHMQMVTELLEKGYDLTMVAAAAFDLCFARDDSALQDIIVERKVVNNGLYRKLMLNVGRKHKVAPNHIVSAIAERALIKGSVIGKIEIYDDKTVVGIPASHAEEIAQAMEGATINGHNILVYLTAEKPSASPRPQDRRTATRANDHRPVRKGDRRFEEAKTENSDAAPRKGKVKISREAKSRLLDGNDLSRFEIGNKQEREHRADHREHKEHRDRKDRHDFRTKRNHDDRRGNRRPSQRKHHG